MWVGSSRDSDDVRGLCLACSCACGGVPHPAARARIPGPTSRSLRRTNGQRRIRSPRGADDLAPRSARAEPLPNPERSVAIGATKRPPTARRSERLANLSPSALDAPLPNAEMQAIGVREAAWYASVEDEPLRREGVKGGARGNEHRKRGEPGTGQSRAENG